MRARALALAALAALSCSRARRDGDRLGAPPRVVAETSAEEREDEAVRATPCGPLRSERRCLVEGLSALGTDRGEGHFEERPAHAVRVGRLVIDRREVSARAWRQCVRAGRCAEPACPTTSDRLPVRCVSWEEARAYCAYRRGRLPTEAEWARAARGVLPSQRLYPWGDALPDAGVAVDRTDEGVQDLAGSVAEWTDDGGDFYPAVPERSDGGVDDAGDAAVYADGLYVREDAQAPASSPWRVVRGGDDRMSVRERTGTLRRFRRPEDRLPWVGLRCVYAPAR